MLSPTLPPTPLIRPFCHSGFCLRMRTTFESVGSSMKPTTYFVLGLVNGFLYYGSHADEYHRTPNEIFQYFVFSLSAVAERQSFKNQSTTPALFFCISRNRNSFIVKSDTHSSKYSPRRRTTCSKCPQV